MSERVEECVGERVAEPARAGAAARGHDVLVQMVLDLLRVPIARLEGPARWAWWEAVALGLAQVREARVRAALRQAAVSHAILCVPAYAAHQLAMLSELERLEARAACAWRDYSAARPLPARLDTEAPR